MRVRLGTNNGSRVPTSRV
ncbi:hypothetical protein MTR67_027272 [Solanum verrucosum]|uniref:Uncharacterized protein n=1 Tax=Solanum verrucosum TaxID=315347 RepID=A0AAF0R4R0_SOLVR|nr:hypothetical protein MTR67_027272 [Solanum verrucosum]